VFIFSFLRILGGSLGGVAVGSVGDGIRCGVESAGVNGGGRFVQAIGWSGVCSLLCAK